jgi:hypothetical protein
VSEFILMLTQHDKTVPRAADLWRSLQGSNVRFVGFKDVGIGPGEIAQLVEVIHETGRPAMLETVSEDERAETDAAELAATLSIEYLLGGSRVGAVSEILAGSGVRYFPFPGTVSGHPSRLEGTVSDIVASARGLAVKDAVSGLDLLAFRHSSDAAGLIRAVVESVPLPVIVAGSIDSFSRVEDVRRVGAWGLTVGSALFDGSLGLPGVSLLEQVNLLVSACAGDPSV